MAESGCDMRTQPPMDFGWCETHDETFPIGGICSFQRQQVQLDAITARARGDVEAERRALDSLALDDRARRGSEVSND